MNKIYGETGNAKPCDLAFGNIFHKMSKGSKAFDNFISLIMYGWVGMI